MRRGLWIMISRFYLYRAREPVIMIAETVPIACAGAMIMIAEAVPRARGTVIMIAEAVPRARGLWIMISRFVAVLRQ